MIRLRIHARTKEKPSAPSVCAAESLNNFRANCLFSIGGFIRNDDNLCGDSVVLRRVTFHSPPQNRLYVLSTPGVDVMRRGNVKCFNLETFLDFMKPKVELM